MAVHDRDVISPRRQRWERASAIPMFIVTVAFIAVYSFLVLAEQFPGPSRPVAAVVLAVSWLAFLVDFVVRLVLSPGHRWLFVRYNLLDLFAVIIPLFRAFRLLRSLREIEYFRRGGPSAARTQVVAYAALFAVLYVYMLSLTELAVERNAPGATITTFGDALWWACVTMATVGYGDTYPVTTAGRVIAVLLMAGGVVIVGAASATVISFMNERVANTSRVRHPDHDKHEGPEHPDQDHNDR
ncbi:ion channel [Rathayibacter sp. YIM 133350]|uniref:potassium channel family protein n=1 Tax=Rathayibacter sp. YIM 133350 TaxID=3131992 RepID=UPI00307F8D4B